MDPRMLAVGGNIIGSFLLGQQQREARLEDQKFKQQQLKMMIDAQKIKDAKEERAAAAEERKQNLFASIFGPELAGGNEVPANSSNSGLKFGETFGNDSSQTTQPKPQSRLLDIMSDPIKAAALKEMTGVDFLGAHNALRMGMAEQRQLMEFLWRQGKEQRDRQFQAGQGTYTTQEVPGGGTVPVFRPSNPTAAAQFGIGGSPALGKQPPQLAAGAPIGYTKLPETLTPVNSDDLPTWRHPSGSKPSPGMTPQELKQKGFVKVSATEVPKLDMLENGIDVLNTIENLMLSAGIPTEGETSRYNGIIRSGKAALQLGKEGQALAKLRDFIDGNKSTIARIGGEVGNLAAQEQEDVKSALGKISDAGPKAWEQFNLVKQKFNRIKARKYGLIPEKISQGVDMIYNPISGQLEPSR